MNNCDKNIDLTGLRRYDYNMKNYVEEKLSFVPEHEASLNEVSNELKTKVNADEFEQEINKKLESSDFYDILPKLINPYATPEMYGAKGDGKTDDTAALQNCINENNVIRLDGHYYVTDTITLNKTFPANPYLVFIGKKIYGHGQITIGVDKNCLEIYGRANKIDGITIKYSSKFLDYTNKVTTYTSTLLSLICPFDDAHGVYPCNDNIITNVNLMSATVQYAQFTKQNGTGIELIAEGSGYCYNNIFDNCSCYGMRTCIKAVETDINKSNGINANIFNVSSWCCECYAEGRFGGSHFKGNCQAKTSNYNGELIREFTGEYNIIETFFYDTRSTGSYSSRQAIVDDAITAKNTFTNHIFPASVLNYTGNNNYVFIQSSNAPSFLTNGYMHGFTNFTRIVPSVNCLPKCLKSATLINKETEDKLPCRVRWANKANYTDYKSDEETLSDCSYLCGDSNSGRNIDLSPLKDSTTGGQFSIQIDIDKNNYVDFLSIELPATKEQARITSAKIQSIDEAGVVLQEGNLLIIQKEAYSVVHGLVNDKAFGITNDNYIRIIITFEINQYVQLQRISGICRHRIYGSY